MGLRRREVIFFAKKLNEAVTSAGKRESKANYFIIEKIQNVMLCKIKNRRMIFVKKLVMVAVLALAALGMLAGCDGEPAENGSAISEGNQKIDGFATVADLEAAFGHNIADFGDNNTEGYVASSFNLVSEEYTLAEVTYTKNDNVIVLRTAHTADGNISGMEVTGDVEEYESNGVAVKYTMVGDDVYLAYWVKDGYSYSVYETEEMEETFFKVLIDYLTAEDGSGSVNTEK